HDERSPRSPAGRLRLRAPVEHPGLARAGVRPRDPGPDPPRSRAGGTCLHPAAELATRHSLARTRPLLGPEGGRPSPSLRPELLLPRAAGRGQAVKIHLLEARADSELAAKLAEFEAEFTYPLGPGRSFRISHCEDYSRFFRSLGRAACFLAMEGDRVVGAVAC